jgi:DNA-binding response OmpR family regulator
MKVDRKRRAEETTRAPLHSQPGPPRRILVVDDEPEMRQLITNSLAREGYQVDVAEDGAAAWEALQVRRYDLMITDNSMPKITGIALVKKLRGQSSALPVVMASGTIPTEELKRHPSLGISAILLKPFSIEEMLNTVKNTLHLAFTGLTELQSTSKPNGPCGVLPGA